MTAQMEGPRSRVEREREPNREARASQGGQDVEGSNRGARSSRGDSRSEYQWTTQY